MLLTKTLLGFLNRVFCKDPARVLAMQFTHQYPMSWQVQDGILTTIVSDGGFGGNLTIDLTQYTFAGLVNYLASQPGYITPYLSPTTAEVSAAALMDASGSVTPDGSGGQLYAYTSVLWAYLEANAAELELAARQIASLPLEMSTTTADTIWLDVLGTYYKVPRLPNEEDSAYGPRIIASVLRPMGNNVAMEIAISVFTGQTTTVTDVVLPGVTGNVYNADHAHDGSIQYDAVSTPVYGLFDVEYGYDLINGQDPTSFAQTITELINTLRDAGTHLRDLSLVGSNLTDTLTPPMDGGALTLDVNYDPEDTLTPPTDADSIIAVNMGSLTDVLTPPVDANGVSNTVTYSYEHNGIRGYNGAIEHMSGQVVEETL